MSTKVLVIPEDPKHNGYILKPIVERVLKEAGRANPRVNLLPRPKLNGISSVKAAIRGETLNAWKWMDLWLFIPDADRTSHESLRSLEEDVAAKGVTMIGCAADPEVEAWMLAGHTGDLTINWSKVTGHERFKEEVFVPFMDKHGFPNLPGQGREKLTKMTLSNYSGLKQRCPEIADLEARIRSHFASSA